MNLGSEPSSFHIKSEVSCFKLKGEDFHFVRPRAQISATVFGLERSVDVALFGVFDGHGGKRAASFASSRVSVCLVEYLQSNAQAAADSTDADNYIAADDSEIEAYRSWMLQDIVVKLAPTAFRTVFQQVHDEFIARQQGSGTTATVALLCGDELVVANVGDSLAYVDTGSSMVLVSGNHRIDDNKAERQRLVDAGGEVGQADIEGEAVGPLRIWPGGLAFSRSIGDSCAGERVLADPTVKQFTVDRIHGARLIIASDGVWDVVSGNAKGLARRVRAVPATKAASQIRSHCKDKRDRDDITVIVVDVLPDDTAKLPPALASAGGRTGSSSRSSSQIVEGRSSVASVEDSHFRQVWDPVEKPERWNEVWRAKMAARTAWLDTRARCTDTLVIEAVQTIGCAVSSISTSETSPHASAQLQSASDMQQTLEQTDGSADAVALSGKSVVDPCKLHAELQALDIKALCLTGTGTRQHDLEVDEDHGTEGGEWHVQQSNVRFRQAQGQGDQNVNAGSRAKRNRGRGRMRSSQLAAGREYAAEELPALSETVKDGVIVHRRVQVSRDGQRGRGGRSVQRRRPRAGTKHCMPGSSPCRADQSESFGRVAIGIA